MTERFIHSKAFKFAVTSDEYQAYTVPGHFVGIETPDSRIERHRIPQKNSVDVTLKIGEKNSDKKRLILWINPRTKVDKKLWTRLTPIWIDGVFGLAQVYASLTDD